MRRARSFLFTAGLAAATLAWQPSLAEVQLTYDAAGKALYSLSVPDNWVVTTGASDGEAERPRIIGLHPEDDLSLWVGFFSPAEVNSMEEAETYVKGMGASIVKDAVVEPPSEGMLGDMPARYYRGRGTRDGAPVDFTVGFVALPGERILIGVFVGEYGAREAYQRQIEAIVHSIKAGETAP